MKPRRLGAEPLVLLGVRADSAAIAADTSSAAAASTPVVGAAAAALAALSAEPIPATSEATDISASGATITNDI